MRSVNPIFIPRNHKVEEALKDANNGDLKKIIDLLEVIKKPFIFIENKIEYSKPNNSTQEYKTYCGT